MNPIVEFCVNNLASGADAAFAKLDADDSLDVIEYDCLTYCDLCATSLFALVDGKWSAEKQQKNWLRIYIHFWKRIRFNIEKSDERVIWLIAFY